MLGENLVADSVAKRLVRDGVTVHRLAAASPSELDQELDAIWSNGETPHLFLTTPFDSASIRDVLNVAEFEKRHRKAIDIPYRLCQRWMQRMIDRDLMASSSLVTLIRGGGGYGLDSDAHPSTDPQKISVESGAMAGLTKAMLIEAWMRGYRDTPMLVIDGHLTAEGVEKFVDQVWEEWAIPSYDQEVSFVNDSRFALGVRHAPLQAADASGSNPSLTRGGTWLVAGGGRGITALAAMALAEKYDLKLHLLGMADPPQLDEATREAARRDRMALRRMTMQTLQSEGRNPVKHWRRMEKAIEIDATLKECDRRGISAEYHGIDISDFERVHQLVATIRRQDGPIRGVIQGAGSGQDARFDRKRPEKVRQCFAAKVDGTIALAHATASDPLEWFVGFGSISGRFGANGHTDYSAANEMLAKLIGQMGRQRKGIEQSPPTRCLTFHWHAWGDIGMATKPEAKLALEMIGMQFMPASEGIAHFLNEFAHGGDASEVLITDRRYIRKFLPTIEDEHPYAAPLILKDKK
ncbi:MAG: SDR family NAD(P)-dependent oxidoreductase, partial [Planctomycetota bacterium]